MPDSPLSASPAEDAGPTGTDAEFLAKVADAVAYTPGIDDAGVYRISATFTRAAVERIRRIAEELTVRAPVASGGSEQFMDTAAYDAAVRCNLVSCAGCDYGKCRATPSSSPAPQVHDCSDPMRCTICSPVAGAHFPSPATGAPMFALDDCSCSDADSCECPPCDFQTPGKICVRVKGHKGDHAMALAKAFAPDAASPPVGGAVRETATPRQGDTTVEGRGTAREATQTPRHSADQAPPTRDGFGSGPQLLSAQRATSPESAAVPCAAPDEGHLGDTDKLSPMCTPVEADAPANDDYLLAGEDAQRFAARTAAEQMADAPADAPPLSDEQVEAGLQEARRIITNGDGYDFGGLRVPFAPEFKSLALRAIAQTVARVAQLEATLVLAKEALSDSHEARDDLESRLTTERTARVLAEQEVLEREATVAELTGEREAAVEWIAAIRDTLTIRGYPGGGRRVGMENFRAVLRDLDESHTARLAAEQRVHELEEQLRMQGDKP